MKPVLAIIATAALLAATACNRAADAAPEPAAAEVAVPAVNFPIIAQGQWRAVSNTGGFRRDDRKCFKTAESVETAVSFTPGFTMNCETTFRKISGGVEAKTSCKNSQYTTEARYTVTGDFQNYYTVDAIIDYTPEWQGLTHVNQMRTFERMGDCE